MCCLDFLVKHCIPAYFWVCWFDGLSLRLPFQAVWEPGTALKDSVNALFWVAMIMLVVEMMFALLLNQVLVALVFGAGHEYSDADQTLLFESSLQADCILQIWAENRFRCMCSICSFNARLMKPS